MVDKPTSWVSLITVVKKPKSLDEIRLCIDMRAPKKAIQRESHVTPTTDDITASLNDATVFSKLDLKNRYHQIELDDSFRFLTVFSTHDGLFQFRRFYFGVNSAAEQFQNLIQSALASLFGVINLSDDILVYGINYVEHNENLKNCCQRLREKNLTLNKRTCEFNKDTVEFFGHAFHSGGISPSPDKVKALQNATPPTNKEQQLHTEVIVNACLCAVLAQQDGDKSVLVALASRSLIQVEQRYSQTEREALAVTWGIKHSTCTCTEDNLRLLQITNRLYLSLTTPLPNHHCA
ncbi:uncharacterized protein K02A2.6-like [Anneissia japonica]|uniref:uncharacterized protein K02A2.6-like n=1 Tax=Anneissia japonica TaxID=1529436 RepID=UPI001425633F|nr:uncharacterized protein K02A2.6-like [Anneissia japonica]